MAQTVAPDPVTEGWYAIAVADLQSLNQKASQLLASGKTDAAAALVTQGQDLQRRLLNPQHPSLPAMEASGDLDDLYGRILMANHNVGWARIVFQKNVARWTNWRPVTPDTQRRKKQAQSRIAECDRQLAQ